MDTRTDLRMQVESCYASGDLHGAHRALRALLGIDPDDAETLNDLGTVCFAMGRHADSEHYLLAALERNPSYPEAQQNLARLCHVLGTTPEAAAERFRAEQAEGAVANDFDISVVVPVHSRFDVLERCIASVHEQEFPAECWELVLVANGVTDPATADLDLRLDPWRRELGDRLQVLRVEDASIAAARNEGIRAARGLVVLQINEDTILTRTALQQHYAEHEAFGFDPRCHVAGGRMFDDEHLASLFNFLYEAIPLYTALHRPGQRFLAEAGDWCVTCNHSALREAYRRFGTFEPSYRWGSDAELGRRWESRHGARLYVNTHIVSYHEHWLSFDSWRDKIIEAVPFWYRRRKGVAPEDLPPAAQEELEQKLESSDIIPAEFEAEMREIQAAFTGPHNFKSVNVLGVPTRTMGELVWRMRAALKGYRTHLQHTEVWRRVQASKGGGEAIEDEAGLRELMEVAVG